MRLTMTKSDLLREGIGELGEERFPDTLNIHHLELPLEYQYEPGSQQDGVTLERAGRGIEPGRPGTAGLAGARHA